MAHEGGCRGGHGAPKENGGSSSRWAGVVIIGIGLLFKGILKRVYRGSIVGFSNIAAIMIRIGFGWILYYNYNGQSNFFEVPTVSIVVALFG